MAESDKPKSAESESQPAQLTQPPQAPPPAPPESSPVSTRGELKADA